MKVCPNCSMRSHETAQDCPNCGTLLEQEIEAGGMAVKTEEFRAKRKRDWLWLVLGVPGMMLFFYLIYYAARLIS